MVDNAYRCCQRLTHSLCTKSLRASHQTPSEPICRSGLSVQKGSLLGPPNKRQNGQFNHLGPAISSTISFLPHKTCTCAREAPGAQLYPTASRSYHKNSWPIGAQHGETTSHGARRSCKKKEKGNGSMSSFVVSSGERGTILRYVQRAVLYRLIGSCGGACELKYDLEHKQSTLSKWKCSCS